MIIFTGQRDHNYRRVPPRSPQQGGRHAVTNCEGFKQMAIKFSGVSEPLQILVDPRHRPFCFKSFPPSSSLCLLEPGSIQQRQSFQICWIHKKGYAFPPFSPICTNVLHKVLIDQATLILITPAWQTQSWCPQTL